eukprot:jgi/Ulvmu1/7516/UM037_0060.1
MVDDTWRSEFNAIITRAKSASQDGQFDAALRCWKSAISLVGAQDDSAKYSLLLDRSRCYVAYSNHLKSIPSATSETAARYAMDPHQLAKLGLADAERAGNMRPDAAEPHICKGYALQAIEEYIDAEAAYFAALSRDPSNIEAQRLIDDMQHLSDQRDPEHAGLQKRLDGCDCMCPLCCKLFCQPVTTPCGHTFCRTCFARAMDHSSKCPLCRRVLHTGRNLPVTVVLQNMIRHAFPQESAAREREIHSRSSGGSTAEGADLPIFVMAPLLPTEKISLNIFEPRYRLMVRRCMEGNKRMGMTCAVTGEDGTHEIPDVITQCEIEECEVQPDGRLSILCRAEHRILYSSSWELDGYRMCRVERVVVDSPCTFQDGMHEQQFRDLDLEATNSMSQAVELVESAPAPMRTAVLSHFADLGEKPDWKTQPERFTFWVSQLLNLQSGDKLLLLMMTDAVRRCEWVSQKLAIAISGPCGILSQTMSEGCRTM